MSKYIRFADPGHSWTKVPVQELERLGIAGAISPYSYYRVASNGEAFAYLEEDLDLDLFFVSKQARGEPVQIDDRHTDGNSSIRKYQSYPSAPNWRETYHQLNLQRQAKEVLPEDEQIAAVVENADFSVDNQGSISILWAKTEAAKEWVAAHISEEALTWGRNGTVVEPRYLRDIVEGIINDGLVVA